MKELLQKIIGLLSPQEYKDDQRKYLYALNEDQNCTRELLDSFGVDYKEQKSAMRGVTEFIVEVDNDRFTQIQEQIRHDSNYSNIVASWDRKEELANLEVSGVIDTTEKFQGTDTRIQSKDLAEIHRLFGRMKSTYTVVFTIDILGTSVLGEYLISSHSDLNITGAVALNGAIKDTTIFKGNSSCMGIAVTNCTLQNISIDYTDTDDDTNNDALYGETATGDFNTNGNETDWDDATFISVPSATVQTIYSTYTAYSPALDEGSSIIAVLRSGHSRHELCVEYQDESDVWHEIISNGNSTTKKTFSVAIPVKAKRIRLKLVHTVGGTYTSYFYSVENYKPK